MGEAVLKNSVGRENKKTLVRRSSHKGGAGDWKTDTCGIFSDMMSLSLVRAL